MNRVELTGRIYNVKVSTTVSGKKVTRFGLSIYVGKGKDGKSQYGFIDCIYFDNILDTESLKDIVGRLTVDTWEKDGKKFSKPSIIVDSIKESEMFSGKKEEKNKSETESQGFDDNLDDINL